MKTFLILSALLLPMSAIAAEEPHGDSVAVDFGASTSEPGTESETASPSQLLEVVVTGVGTDPEKALQNAFTHAIEQAVGVLVDAETLVENDEIISDKVLTFSRGYVDQYKALKDWQEDGLHYCRIRATVSAEKLTEKLVASNVTVREVAGELLVLRALHELDSVEKAAEMFRKAMRDYAMRKLVKVEIIEKPETVEKDEHRAKLQVKVKLSFDQEKWETFRQNLKPLLTKVAGSNRASFSTARQPPQTRMPSSSSGWEGWYPTLVGSLEEQGMLRRLGESGSLVYLFNDMNQSASKTDWDAFAVPEALVEVLEDVGERMSHLRIALVDANDATIVQVTWSIEAWSGEAIELLGRQNVTSAYPTPGELWVGPLLWLQRSAYSRSFVVEEIVEIELDKLRDVVKVAASIEEGPAPKK